MSSDCILALDQGTTNTKALLIDRRGRAIFRASSAVSLLQPAPGYVEQDPIELWHSAQTVLRDCAARARAENMKIAGIAISNQRETAVTWRPAQNAKGSMAGAPVCNAISWQCRRSEPECETMLPAAELLRDRTGLPLDPLLTATKWMWLLNQHAPLRGELERGEVLLGTVDSWLLYNLTDGRVHATDLTNASRVALLNLDRLNWDDQLLELFDIPQKALPAIKPSSGLFGECTAISELAGIPIVAMIGDSHAALVGHGCYTPGTVKATYGTGSSLMMLTTDLVVPLSSLARTIAWSLPGKVQYALEGNIAMSGAALHWVGDFLGLPDPAQDAAVLAQTVASAEGMILVPAMVGLGAPHWDSTARGLIANLERGHTSAHLARAALDSIAMQVADVLDAMETAAGVKVPLLLADGGATKNQTLMQIQADILNRRVRRSEVVELSARGAALLGGIALGWWPDMEAVSMLPADGDTFDPKIDEHQRNTRRAEWRTALARTRLSASRHDR